MTYNSLASSLLCQVSMITTGTEWFTYSSGTIIKPEKDVHLDYITANYNTEKICALRVKRVCHMLRHFSHYIARVVNEIWCYNFCHMLRQFSQYIARVLNEICKCYNFYVEERGVAAREPRLIHHPLLLLLSCFLPGKRYCETIVNRHTCCVSFNQAK